MGEAHDHDHHHEPLSTAGDWDARYTTDPDRIWSGLPNPALVAEAGPIQPGRAIDLGCGEGADAIWLARRGWDVTGVDISRVAIDRASEAARVAGVLVVWRCTDFLEDPPPSGSYDLVTTHYPAILVGRADAAIDAMTGAVAPGGTLLFVGHDVADPSVALSHGFDPDDYLQPADIVGHLQQGWTIDVHESRDRPESPTDRSPHHRDVVLRATRA